MYKTSIVMTINKIIVKKKGFNIKNERKSFMSDCGIWIFTEYLLRM